MDGDILPIDLTQWVSEGNPDRITKDSIYINNGEYVTLFNPTDNLKAKFKVTRSGGHTGSIGLRVGEKRTIQKGQSEWVSIVATQTSEDTGLPKWSAQHKMTTEQKRQVESQISKLRGEKVDPYTGIPYDYVGKPKPCLMVIGITLIAFLWMVLWI